MTIGCMTTEGNSDTEVNSTGAAAASLRAATPELQVFKTVNVAATGYALVIEPTPCMAAALQDLGWRCDSYHPRSMIEASSQQIGGWIREGKYSFVWIRFPWKQVLPKNKITRFEQMSKSWLHLAGACQILAVHCKLVAGMDWCHDECYMADKFTSQHHLCRFGIA